MAAVLMGLFVGIAFYHIPESISGIRTWEAILYTSVGLQEYLIMMYEVYRLMMIDLPIFDREHSEGIVGIVPWVLSYHSAHTMLEDIIIPLLFSAITYFMVGLAPSTDRFFYYFAIALLNHYIAVTLAGFATAMTWDFAKAMTIANTAFMLHMYPCGFFIQADAIPIYAVDKMDFTSFIVLYITGQVLLLCLFKVNITMLGTKHQEDGPGHILNVPVPVLTLNSIMGITVNLMDYTLKVCPRRGRDATILQGITSCFKAGKVNVILGPSGSWKSSLLNLMAHRLWSNVQTTYVAKRTMTLNGVPAKPEVMSTLCSYVTQDDSTLLLYLTVQEMLQFSASLQLQSTMSKEKKRHRADEVMLKMGLKECHHTLIGNELLNGISGGEKQQFF
ncbi:hypothetical protein IW261DRAFT_1575407 [Armillaria novae-zelandiae]|uniref:ABC transporter domain-containing protein n=1 Tax=Armillaria novae-zelandiae TaxID=153914 RepID=A0AA39NEK9_9AGAR|nr:hypothetical protein IW261DRAFT_1575407 [Armillaria novae-zelandiae]